MWSSSRVVIACGRVVASGNYLVVVFVFSRCGRVAAKQSTYDKQVKPTRSMPAATREARREKRRHKDGTGLALNSFDTTLGVLLSSEPKIASLVWDKVIPLLTQGDPSPNTDSYLSVIYRMSFKEVTGGGKKRRYRSAGKLHKKAKAVFTGWACKNRRLTVCSRPLLKRPSP